MPSIILTRKHYIIIYIYNIDCYNNLGCTRVAHYHRTCEKILKSGKPIFFVKTMTIITIIGSPFQRKLHNSRSTNPEQKYRDNNVKLKQTFYRHIITSELNHISTQAFRRVQFDCYSRRINCAIQQRYLTCRLFCFNGK